MPHSSQPSQLSQVSSLERKIQLANAAYSKGQPFLTDWEYDQLWIELRSRKPESPYLYHTSRDPSQTNMITHSPRILSLQKAFDMEDLKVFLQRFGSQRLQIQPKYDGIAVMVYKTSSDKLLLAKVGDGDKGEDISRHIPSLEIPPFDGPKLSCEALILWEDWSSELGANPRNVVAGLMNRLSSEGFPTKVSLIPHDSLSLEVEASSLNETFLLETFAKWSKTLPMDGLVLKVVDPSLRLKASHNRVFPYWAIAWKPPIQTAETTIREIEWNISRQGRAIPTLIYDPVNLCGTTNTRVTGNNPEWIASRKLGPSAKVRIGKAGEIIPQVVEVLQESPNSQLPEVCPICGSPLRWDGPHLMCISSKCLPQLVKRLSHFYSHKGVEVKHLGERMLEKLLNNPRAYRILKTSLWAILEPANFGISEVLRLEFGSKIYKNLLSELPESQICPAQFISGLGYSRLSFQSALTLLQITAGYSPKAKNISALARSNFQHALGDLVTASKEFSELSFSQIPPPPELVFSVSGVLSVSRDEIINRLSAKGWTFKNNVSRETDYLILGELDHKTRKLRDARRLGTKILKEEDIFL